jgi:hypothetical protein
MMNDCGIRYTFAGLAAVFGAVVVKAELEKRGVRLPGLPGSRNALEEEHDELGELQRLGRGDVQLSFDDEG